MPIILLTTYLPLRSHGNGNDHQPMLTLVKRMLDRAGAEEMDSEQLKIEWYKLASEFGFGVREHFSSFSINGLDENFEKSLELAKNICFFQR